MDDEPYEPPNTARKAQLMNRLYNIMKNKNKPTDDQPKALNLNARKKSIKEESQPINIHFPKLQLPVKKEAAREPTFNESYLEPGNASTIIDKARREINTQVSLRKTIRGSFHADREESKESREQKRRGMSYREEKEEPTTAISTARKDDKFMQAFDKNSQLGLFFKMVRQKKFVADQFVYMIRRQPNDHYNMDIISYSDINDRGIKDYYTFSSKGVGKFVNAKPVQFITVTQWLDQVKSFNEISGYKFFKLFRKWKTLMKWIKIVNNERKRKISNTLSQKLFLANDMYQKILLNHKNLCCQIEQLDFLNLHVRNPLSKQEFLQSKNQSSEEFTTTLSAFSTRLHENTQMGFKILLDGLKSTFSYEDSKKEGALGFPENMKYGDRALMRQELVNIVRMAYLIEFVTIESLGRCYLRNGSQIILSLQKPLTSLQTYNKQIPGFDEGVTKAKQNVGDPIFTLKFNFKPNPNAPYEITKLPEDPKIKQFDLQYWEKSETRTFPAIEQSITIDPYEQQLSQIIISAFKESNVDRSIRNWRTKMQPYVNALEEWDDVIGGRNRNNQNVQEFLNPMYWIKEQQSYANMFKTIKLLMQKGFDYVYRFRKEHLEYLTIFQRQFTAKIQTLQQQGQYKGPNELFQKIIKLNAELLQKLESRLIENNELGLFMVECQQLNKHFIEEQKNNISRLHKFVEKHLDKVEKECRQFLQASISRLRQPKELQEFTDQRQNLNNLATTLPEITEKLNLLNSIPQLLEAIKTPGLQTLITSVLVLGATHSNQMGQIENYINSNTDKFKKDYKELEKKLNKEIEAKLTEIQDKKWMTLEYGPDILRLKPQVDELENEVQKMASYEDALGISGQGNFQSMFTLKQEYNLRYSVWTSIEKFQELAKEWNNTLFRTVDAKPMIQKCQQYIRIVNQAERGLPENNVVPKLKQIVWQYKDSLPAVQALRSQYLQEPHWQAINSLLGVQINPQDIKLELKDLFAYKIRDFAPDLIEISVQALQQSNLKKALSQIKTAMNDTNMVIKPYKDSFVLGQVDELTVILDEMMANLNNILANRYVTAVRPIAEQSLQEVQLIMDIIEKWTEAQRKWMYLENIFASPDIKKQMPQEAHLFENCDKIIRQHVKKSNLSPKLVRLVAKTNGAILLKKLTETTQILQRIEKQLEQYLEGKRKQFPRFYFLSNDELLEILAKSNILEMVEQHLGKCFEGLVRLYMGQGKSTANSSLVQGMISPEKEVIAFKNIFPAKGNVEIWLETLQKEMFETIRKIIGQGFKDFMTGNQKKTDWIRSHKSQVVAVASQIIWTFSTQEAFKQLSTTGQAMSQHLQGIHRQLTELTAMVRSDLSSILRKVIISLMTTEVHNRDIIQQLVSIECDSINDFQWQQQLRYYATEQQTIVKQVTSTLSYGNQYLGATSRLVITPLTDRCWITITSALANKLGASPAGPAGTGKTQSTKDLAKGLGRLCIVFNCSDQITAMMMNKLFKGLAQQGAWSCLDEFNRIDIEVLSVIAQQLLIIRMAMLSKEPSPSGVITFDFEGDVIPLRPNYGVFITMNPGYAGRTELPDNLKSLFRPVSMMIPDYAMIAEIMLFAEGFQNASVLSKKMVQLYKLSSQQLSQQDHYDFGMRAVKSLLVMAGSLKRAEPNLQEDSILIKAMKSSNIPKFLKNDIPLFTSLIYDLFPTIKIPEPVVSKLEELLPGELVKMKLQPYAPFQQKVIQLYDTFNVRFGVMLVGASGSGKTTCYKTLAHASNTMKANNEPNFFKVEYRVLNPKSITMGQLYGQVDVFTQEWMDGLASSIIREVNTNQIEDPNWDPTQKYWVVFDGPVDALWIENMNTVLDDNMTLCLANSQRIKLRQELRMLFEVQDLSVASPATVSRCGMVYLSFDNLHWSLYVKSWMERTFVTEQSKLSPEDTRIYLHPDALEHLNGLFNRSIEKGFERKKPLYEPFPTTMIQIAKNICNIIETMMRGIDFKVEQLNKVISCLYIYSFIWGFAGGISYVHNAEITKIIEDLFDFNFPKADCIFDYFINMDNPKTFLNWATKVPEFTYNKEVPFFQMLVATIDTQKYSYLIEAMLDIEKPVILTGQSGVGKSALVANLLKDLKETKRINTININFSAQTKAKEVQLAIEAKLQKKGKTMFGARPNEKICIFVDDINMPALEFYGAQPCIELLRLLVDLGGFYDRSKLFFKQVVDTTLLPVCAPPGGGRNQLSFRFLRHMLPLMFPTPNPSTAFKIFNSLLAPNCSFSQPIVYTTIAVFERVAKELLPTPSKFHYVFNMRDIGKVIQGIGKGKQETIVKLFIHEIRRVFADRMLQEDYIWFRGVVMESYKRYFSNPSLVTEETFNCLFTDILKRDAGVSIFEQVTDKRKLIKILEDKQDDYNFSSNDKLNLVFFEEAIEQILRICRILRQPRGNAMLIGVGGSGKQSLSKLASHIMKCRPFQIQIDKKYNSQSFRNDLKEICRITGCDRQSLSFIFTDVQIAYESFLQDINNILNTGEVPNLFVKKDEIEEVYNKLRPHAIKNKIQDSPEPLWNYFINNIRENLHIILCMSPVGQALRVRCRKFPSLVNCCNLDWFPNWSKEALLEVASRFLANIDLEEQLRGSLAKMCMIVATDVNTTCDRYYKELRRKVYTTPKSYLDQIKLYSKLLSVKREEIDKVKRKLSFGLEKLHATNEIVAKLQIEMQELQPKLAEQSEKTEKFLVQLAEDRQVASKVEAVVEEQASLVNIQQAQIKAITDEAQAELAKAIPALKEAEEALNKLNKNDITEIKGFASPPPAVVMVLEAVCILLEETATWDSAKKVMMEMGFLDRLKTYNRNTIPPEVLRKLRVLTNKPEFDPVDIGKKSAACRSLAMWCKAMDNYSKIAKEVQPKKKKVAEMSAKLDIKNKELKAKQDELQKVKDKVMKLQRQCDETLALKHKLEEDMVKTSNRLVSAEKLTVLLHDEGVRWDQQISTIDQEIQNLIGDVFLSAATISYLGPFTGNYREPLIQSWKEQFKNSSIPFSEGYALAKTLQTPIQIREWIVEGLANDALSIDNGVITTKCQRWPLLIDPQGQANKWIKKHEKKNQLKIINFSEQYYLMTIKNAVNSGYPVLIENVEETLESAIDSVLQKQTYDKDNRKVIRVGTDEVDYNPQFKMYITTKMANPHYLPEIYIKVTVINFSITFEGLKDQLLGDVMKFEQPEIEKQRDEVVVSISEGKRILKEAQDNILTLLSESKGMILDNLELIKTLEQSKTNSEKIQKSLEQTTAIEQKINVSRNNYIPVSIRGTVLYFVISQLSLIDPMYQFSLTYFKKLFNVAMQESAKSDDLAKRLQNLNESITRKLFTDICRGLFESHKKIYSFLICTSIRRQNGKIQPKQWNLLIRGTTASTTIENPDPNFISQPSWDFLTAVSGTVDELMGLSQHIKENLAQWKEVAKQPNIFKATLPKPYDTIGNFNRLFLVKGFVSEKIMKEFSNYTALQMGSFYQEVKNTTMEQILATSDEKTPIIFILSTGADPTQSLLKFGETKDKVPAVISLGQGQGKKAQNLINKAKKDGSWVLLTNCHLAKSWMPQLQKIVLGFSENYEGSDQFRLFLTSMPANYFPVAVLQNGTKMTLEPPRGLKANLKRSWQEITNKTLASCESKNHEWHKLLFSLTFFHAIIQERRKFGPLGFNIRYEFNDSDLQISIATLKMFLSEQQQIPWQAMIYMTGHINYGGRVTDDWDRICLLSILKKYYNQDVLTIDKYSFSPSKVYHIQPHGTVESYRDYISRLPNFDDPEVFGMHENANITFQNQESAKIMETILAIQPRVSSADGGGPTPDELVSQMAKNLLEQVPLPLDQTKGNPDHFVINDSGNMKSLSIVLLQQIQKFNNLISTLNKTLSNLQKAIQGLIIMSQDLDEMYLAFQNNVLPGIWKKVSYSSLKPLSSWFKDMLQRVEFMRNWLMVKTPNSFWMSGFYFPQGFLTGVLQTHSRQYQLPIDTLNFKFKVLPVQKQKLTAPPADGVYIDGLFFDGARWDLKEDTIIDQVIGKLYFPMPVIHFLPLDKYILPDNFYRCPCYKTSNRAGVLSTTGQSTNFILPVDLHTKYEKPEFWTLRGTALLCQLDD